MRINEVYHLIVYCLNCIRRDQNKADKLDSTEQLCFDKHYPCLKQTCYAQVNDVAC